MVSIPGGDYATARPTIASMQQAGWKFVCRYLRDLVKSNGDKSLSESEVDGLRQAGIDLVSNEETTGEQGLTGYDGGVRDARAADGAHRACGGPWRRPIYFSPWDHDPALLTSAQWKAMASYLHGCTTALGGIQRVGLYGGRTMLTWAFDNRLITYGWQAAGWAHGGIEPRAHIIQHVGTPIPGTDQDTAIKSDYGQWHYGQQTDWSDMATAEEVKQAVKDALSEWGAAKHSDALAILGDQATRPKNLTSIYDVAMNIRDLVDPDRLPPEA